jgi:hypothetical protein
MQTKSLTFNLKKMKTSLKLALAALTLVVAVLSSIPSSYAELPGGKCVGTGACGATAGGTQVYGKWTES